MLGDISSPEAVERERRSVTMLQPRAPVYNREEAVAVLEALAAALAAAEQNRSRTPSAAPGHRRPPSATDPA